VSAVVIEVADAVVRTLNDGSFSQSFVAERTYDPERALAEYQTLRVTVVPKGRQMQFADRSRMQQDVAIDVAIQRRVASDTETDEMMALVDEVLDYWKDHRILKDSQQNTPPRRPRVDQRADPDLSSDSVMPMDRTDYHDIRHLIPHRFVLRQLLWPTSTAAWTWFPTWHLAWWNRMTWPGPCSIDCSSPV